MFLKMFILVLLFVVFDALVERQIQNGDWDD